MTGQAVEQTGIKFSEARNKFKAKSIKLENDSNRLRKGRDIKCKCSYVGLSLSNTQNTKTHWKKTHTSNECFSFK